MEDLANHVVSLPVSPISASSACAMDVQIFAWIVGTCIAFSYVVSLYLHPGGRNFFAFPSGERNDPVEIKSRFKRVFCASVFCFLVSSAFQVYAGLGGSKETSAVVDVSSKILSNMGFRTTGVACAAIMPVLLTLILFSGPLVADYIFGHFAGYNRVFLSLLYHNLHFRRRVLRDSLYSLLWWRAYVVAPLSEEFVYRACLVPVIIPCFGASTAILISPLSFGIAHLHHIFDRIRLGASVQTAVTSTLFQIAYTAVFGAYSAYLFVRTGHFIAPVLVHALCNVLGVPDVVAAVRSRNRLIIGAVYLLGFILWVILLEPLTDPSIYGNV